jgi:hypothetical protein
MRIAVIGSGIAGMGAAWLLGRQHDVVLFEASDRLGGHTDTHDLDIDGQQYAIDTGFIVFNPDHYPNLVRLFAELGVESQPTVMSFAARNERSGLEYNATDLNRLFCQRRNLLRPSFLKMVWDIARFYRQAPQLLASSDPGPSLGAYLDAGGYGKLFRNDHLIPMASALWSSSSVRIEDFPARYLVQFMANHNMLKLGDRPAWRVVKGGSSRYIDALKARWRVQVRVATPVTRVQRSDDGVVIDWQGHREHFDQVVMACHSDQALALLADPSTYETEVLGAIRYQANDTVLHTDESLLPRNRRAWAAWNAHIPREAGEHCTVSYCMNQLQSITASRTFIVSLNCTDRIDPSKILRRRAYHHPVYSHSMVAAQQRRGQINGQRRTWYCGAYWGFGFHEDGLRSGVEVAQALGCDW